MALVLNLTSLRMTPANLYGQPQTNIAVNLSQGAGITLTPSPITGVGTIAVTNPLPGPIAAFPIGVGIGGTGVATFSAGYLKSPGGTGALVTQAVPIPIADGGTNATTIPTNTAVVFISGGAYTGDATKLTWDGNNLGIQAAAGVAVAPIDVSPLSGANVQCLNLRQGVTLGGAALTFSDSTGATQRGAIQSNGTTDLSFYSEFTAGALQFFSHNIKRADITNAGLFRVQAAFAFPYQSLTLGGGINSNIALTTGTFFHVTGPVSPYSIGGFQSPSDGQNLILYLAAAQTCTIINEDLGSTAGNRIKTLTGANVTLNLLSPACIEFIYDFLDSRWIFLDPTLASGFLRQDGTTPLTANWNAGAFKITANAFALPTAAVGTLTSIISQPYSSTSGILAGIIIPANGVSNANAFGLLGGNTTLSSTLAGQAEINVGVGPGALQGLTTGFANTAFGWDALFSDTTGYFNTAVGDNALGFNTTGQSNVAVGKWAAFNNVGGNYNVAIGVNALQLPASTTVSANTAVGYQTLAATTVDNGTAVGYLALTANTTGTFNTALGTQALVANTIGGNNTAVGMQSLFTNQGGGFNTAMGVGALQLSFSGSTNTAVGASALANESTGSGNVALGYNAGKYETASNAFYIDNQDRTNTAGDKANAILYGTFAAAAANQTLTANAAVTVNGKFSTIQSTLSLVNGANQNIAPTSSLVYITGPTAAFSIGGIAGGTSGQIVTFINSVAFAMTINYSDAGSSAGNRIFNSTLANVACGGTSFAWATVQYSPSVGGWVLLGHS